MTFDQGAFLGAVAEHPAAAVIRDFAGRNRRAGNRRTDRIFVGIEDDDIAEDVARLLVAAKSGPMFEPNGPDEQLAAIREHLARAETLAASLPEDLRDLMRATAPADNDLAAMIGALRQSVDAKLAVGEAMIADEAARTPRDRRKRRKEEGFAVALEAARIFERRIGTPTFASTNQKEPRSEFGYFVEALFRSLFPKTADRPGWYYPTKSAVTLIGKNE